MKNVKIVIILKYNVIFKMNNEINKRIENDFIFLLIFQIVKKLLKKNFNIFLFIFLIKFFYLLNYKIK